MSESEKQTTHEVNEIVMILYLTARELWRSSLHSTERFNEMKNVSKGDLVFESSSFKQRVNKENVMDYVGYMEEMNDNGWECTIRRFDGKKIKWGNCEFLKIPVEVPLAKTAQHTT